MHLIEDLIQIFDNCFYKSHNTRLIIGDFEPLYLPAGHGASYAQIIFAHGFFSSALHEIAHWLYAGPKRRSMEDFGYWYAPDGRTKEEQELFQMVEVKPQAIEWILSKACGFDFKASIDNLNGETIDSLPFKKEILKTAQNYLLNGLSDRQQTLVQALCKFYKKTPDIQILDSELELI